MVRFKFLLAECSFVCTNKKRCFAVYFCENCATTATTKGKITETLELQKQSLDTKK